MTEVKDREYTTLHIGRCIKEEMRRQERQVSWLARKLCCDRTNIYKLYDRPSIDTALLLRISQALRHDFFLDYSRSACGVIGHSSV